MAEKRAKKEEYSSDAPVLRNKKEYDAYVASLKKTKKPTAKKKATK